MNEKARAQITSLEIKLEQQKSRLMETKTRQQIEDGKMEESQGADGKGWKAAVVTRMYEDRLKSLESELEKKVLIICLVTGILKKKIHIKVIIANKQGSFVNKIVLGTNTKWSKKCGGLNSETYLHAY